MNMNILFRCLGVCLCFITIGFQPSKQALAAASKTVAEKYDPAYDPISEQDLIAAIRSVKTSDDQREILNLRAKHSHLGEIAVDEYEKLVAQHPKNLAYLCGYIDAYYSMRLVVYHTENPTLFKKQNAGNYQGKMQRLAKTVIKGEGKNRAYCWEVYGMLQTLYNFVDKGVSAYKKAAELNPTNGRYFSWIANLYLVKGRYSEAIAAAQRAAQITPNLSTAYRWQAVGYMNLKKYKEAYEAEKESAEHIDPKALSAHRLMRLEAYKKKAEKEGMR
jgi:tetratricopeptide (TPR) repeat protein